ncbi:PREDICTED: histidine-containing phosphotransfer [Prunus dulcis]|uniref:Histidine-containing phosphotransfer protein n=1 Tax=Prunus dulcis TaxID=3755 RepID=A0A5E4FK88_PRUDU|nr:PREDICTED: histidine-containing phosphotransfer [Prunus dulcis]
MKAVQNEQNPCFVVNLITTFLGDAENILAQLRTYLSAEDPDEVNYPQVATLALTLKGSSSSVGGCRMALACSQLRDVSDVNDHEGDDNEPVWGQFETGYGNTMSSSPPLSSVKIAH